MLGGYVRDYCLKYKTSFQLIDLNWKVYASLPPRKLPQFYACRKYAASGRKSMPIIVLDELVPFDAASWRPKYQADFDLCRLTPGVRMDREYAAAL